MTRKSGWCMLEDPEQHRLCPKNFTSGECPCDCGHPGEKPLERLRVSKPVASTKKSKSKENLTVD